MVTHDIDYQAAGLPEPASMSGLSDWSGTPTNGQVPAYNSTSGKFEPVTPGTGVSTLAGLSDVAGSPANGQRLIYNSASGKWEPDTAAVVEAVGGVTKTVKTSGGDFTTIQAGIDWFAAQKLTSACYLDVDAGTWEGFSALTGDLSLLTIRGDQRTIAGKVYSATGSITKGGDNCTITLTETPTDIVGGDYITVCGKYTSSGNKGRFPVISVDTVNKQITYTNSSGVAEAMASASYAFVVLNPNRVITKSTVGGASHIESAVSITISGFTTASINGKGDKCLRRS